MQSPTPFKWSSFIISVLGIIFFSMMMMTLGGASSHGDQLKLSLLSTSSPSPKKTLGLPTRLAIPKLKVDAPVQYVGLTPDGFMDVPKGPADVAWFNIGPRPGQKGSAVMAGHFGVWKNGQVSVFNKLHTLRKGDLVSIKDDQGIKISFVVRGIKTYTPNAYAPEVFGSSDGKAHLNLVTCIWDKVSKSYSKRLVVFTDKI